MSRDIENLNRKLEDMRQAQKGEFDAIMQAMSDTKQALSATQKGLVTTQKAMRRYHRSTDLILGTVLESHVDLDSRMQSVERRVTVLEQGRP